MHIMFKICLNIFNDVQAGGQMKIIENTSFYVVHAGFWGIFWIVFS